MSELIEDAKSKFKIQRLHELQASYLVKSSIFILIKIIKYFESFVENKEMAYWANVYLSSIEFIDWDSYLEELKMFSEDM